MTTANWTKAERAHPRSRGENGALCNGGATEVGSSPLTRGKQAGVFLGIAWSGLIPAHAGKTTDEDRRPLWCRAHPRSRGENYQGPAQAWETAGSSPLTRGKHARLSACITGSGLIPAHAGKTTSGDHPTHEPRAHPRSRGENSGVPSIRPTAPGSSPLTRGKRGIIKGGDSAARLIPAHAGKTARTDTTRARRRAHPRSRGENKNFWSTVLQPLGSSPLTRGKLRLRCVGHLGLGLIPAHAGKTLPDLRFYRADRSDLGKP